MHSYLNSWYKATKRNNELKFTTQSAFPLKKKASNYAISQTFYGDVRLFNQNGSPISLQLAQTFSYNKPI